MNWTNCRLICQCFKRYYANCIFRNIHFAIYLFFPLQVDKWMKDNNNGQLNQSDTAKLLEFQTKLEESIQENRQMRFAMMDKETTIAIMRSDLVQLRTQYEEKCKELLLERERMIQDQEHLSRQIHVLV